MIEDFVIQRNKIEAGYFLTFLAATSLRLLLGRDFSAMSEASSDPSDCDT
jgi:hypothetical protein